MKLTVEENRETIKRYAHIRPAPPWASARCSVRCPGSSRVCTLEQGHRGHHVAHGMFQRVVAVWASGARARKAIERADRAGGSTQRRGPRDEGLTAALEALRGHIVRATPSIEGVVLLILGLSMVGFALDWALRILGLK